jgi:L-ribulokinase
MAYTIGLDFGSNSVRSLIVDTATGEEVGTAVYNYQSGEAGIILDPADHNLARQNPADYIQGIETTIQAAVETARQQHKDFSPEKVIGIGVDTTGSTPIPVDEKGNPLSMRNEFANNPNALAWLWKDHTGYVEASEITAMAQKYHPEYLSRCGGTYSSEWFFSKILHCLRVDPKVYDAAYTWVEFADYIPAVLTGNTAPGRFKSSRCAAGHKAMFNDSWGGYPAKEFLAKLDPKLGLFRDRLPNQTYTIDTAAGTLTVEWAQKLGLKQGIPVAVGAIDAHLGAVGSGVDSGKLAQILGTSSCVISVWPSSESLADIPGVCGIVDGSVLPGYFGIEAGQSAVGDIYNWFVNYLQPGGSEKGSHEALTRKAEKLRPGQSGLLALDWNNGNRTILIDQRLTGLILGQTLHTRPEEMYRALIEATAFGMLTIINQMEKYGVMVKSIINCGGIAEKNPMLMQIYADILGRDMLVSRSAQTCALGSAIAGAVVAGPAVGGYANFKEAQKTMCGIKDKKYQPIPENQKVYQRLYSLYQLLHDAFGTKEWTGNLAGVMKELLTIKEQVRDTSVNM